jgi:hypothetical protein
MVEFKNEQQYAKRFQDSEKEFKASKNKFFDFEVNFDKAYNNISLLEKEIVSIGDQMQKMNDDEVAVFYPLPLESQHSCEDIMQSQCMPILWTLVCL